MANIYTTLIDEVSGDRIYPTIVNECVGDGELSGSKIDPGTILPDRLFPNSITDNNIAFKALTRNSIKNGTLTFNENEQNRYYYRIICAKNNTEFCATLITTSATVTSGTITFDQFKALLDNDLQQSCSFTGVEASTSGANVIITFYTEISIENSQYAMKGTSINITTGVMNKTSASLLTNPFTSIKIQKCTQIN